MTERHDAIGSDGVAEIIAVPPEQELGISRLARLLARVPRQALFKQIGWVTGAYGFTQVTRLATNVVLTKLLAPQLFGIMLLINTLRTGFELLSDIGITHNIISNPRGNTPDFFNTAFTLQIIRSFVLAGLVLVIAGPLTRLYAHPELNLLVPLMSILFVLSGLHAPSRILLIKNGNVRVNALSDILFAVISVVINVGLALYTPTIWALFIGLILTTLLHTIFSYLLMEPGVLRLQLDRRSVREIISFGKWVFASSLVYFLAMNYDRLYLAKSVPLAVLGIYGVARTFSDAGGQFVQRIGDVLIYPKIAATQKDGAQLRQVVAPIRGHLLFVIAAGLAIAIAVSDQIIILLYDARYHAAAFMLPVLLAGVWFAVLAALGDAILMGTSRPAHSARANFVKFAFTCAGLPLALYYDGMVAAIFVIVGADMVRYVSQALSQRAQGLSFARQDIALTAALLGMIVSWRILFTELGIVPDPYTWWSYAEKLHG